MEKQDLREAVWDALEAAGEARFPFPPHDRIPNFAGADAAAERLEATDEWRAADVVKSNPDAPQLPVRRAALRAGKTVYMAVPRLRESECFLELDPAEVPDIDEATTVSGSSKHGVPVHPEAVPDVDLVVAGSVAVSEEGARVGKGEGYSDLEWAVLAGFDRVDADTTVATTVHELQVVGSEVFEREVAPDVAGEDPSATLEPDPHDVPLDIVCTPERTVRTDTPYDRPAGIDWDALDDEKVAEIPVLQELRAER